MWCVGKVPRILNIRTRRSECSCWRSYPHVTCKSSHYPHFVIGACIFRICDGRQTFRSELKGGTKQRRGTVGAPKRVGGGGCLPAGPHKRNLRTQILWTRSYERLYLFYASA
jgi:hypothetical protein